MTILLAFIASDALSQTDNTPEATVAIVNNIPITEADVDFGGQADTISGQGHAKAHR